MEGQGLLLPPALLAAVGLLRLRQQFDHPNQLGARQELLAQWRRILLARTLEAASLVPRAQRQLAFVALERLACCRRKACPSGYGRQRPKLQRHLCQSKKHHCTDKRGTFSTQPEQSDTPPATTACRHWEGASFGRLGTVLS